MINESCDTNQSIHQAFNNEYRQKAVDAATGFLGKAARANVAYNKWHRNNPFKSVGIMLGVIAACAMTGGTAFGLLGMFLGAFTPLAIVLPADKAMWTVFNKATDAINADIANGTLVTRYKDEVLIPEIARLESIRASLPEAGALSKGFAASAIPQAQEHVRDYEGPSELCQYGKNMRGR